jgi:hypothetical protein
VSLRIRLRDAFAVVACFLARVAESRRVALPPRRMILLVVVTLAAIAFLVIFPTIGSRAEEPDNSRLDELFEPVRAWQSQPGFHLGNFPAAIRNLAAAAAAEPKLSVVLSEQRQQLEPTAVHIVGLQKGGALSSPDLSLSRFTGFTQSETSAAWCGSGLVIAFNDTGAEITTVAAGNGVSSIGFAASSNTGSSFQYLGAPATAANFSQILVGDPVVVCANAQTFFYSSTWMDGLAMVSGIAVAESTNGGSTFAAPVAAIAKLNSGHVISRGWLAIDSASTSNLYLSYVDFDFTGTFCGTNISGQPTVRYAVELVSSANSGSTWSAPTVVEQVCEDSTSPSAMVANPETIVDPQGIIYVVWEATGENGGTVTTRQIKIASSTDGGSSFSAPVQIATVTPIGDGADLQAFIHQFESPSIAIGKGPHNTGSVHVAWSNAASSPPDRLSSTGVYGFSEIEFSSSPSGGANWSNPVRVNDNIESASTPTDQFEPAIGTDKTGEIVVCFYDRRRDNNNFLIDRYCATSTNFGATWKNTKVTTSNFPPLVGEDALVALDYMGEYDAVVSDMLNTKSGLMAPYATNAPGNPTVEMKKF